MKLEDYNKNHWAQEIHSPRVSPTDSVMVGKIRGKDMFCF